MGLVVTFGASITFAVVIQNSSSHRTRSRDIPVRYACWELALSGPVLDRYQGTLVLDRSGWALAYENMGVLLGSCQYGKVDNPETYMRKTSSTNLSQI